MNNADNNLSNNIKQYFKQYYQYKTILNQYSQILYIIMKTTLQTKLNNIYKYQTI